MWITIGLTITVIGNLSTILSLFPWLNNILSGAINTEPLKSILEWLAYNWGFIVLIIVLCSIINGMYSKTKV